ncbi:MAG TPA: ceramide glucosyltransferase, partial [Thermoanaerobaculia bacterium]|nr:ceramide glucosyltransferase [Thermoanaerobaculia bacterium]
MTAVLALAVLALAGAALLAGCSLFLIRQKAPAGGALPAVSILKPLKGADPDLAENLASFYRLDYPEYEIVFSFASRTDPAAEIARRVADAHPAVPTAFVFDSREPGANPKVSRLIHAMSRARYPVLLISDGDVRVRAGFLRDTAAELADPSVGLVSNPFRGVGNGSAGSVVEALHFNGFVFGGTAAVSRVARRPCVVGKSILIRRAALDWIGGLDAVKDFLAEDYLLGAAVAGSGFRVVLARHVVDAVSRGRTLRQFWDRQVRWARMRRRLGGPAYPLEALASPLPWALLLSGSRFAGAAAAIVAAKVALDLVVLRRLGARASVPAILLKDLLFFGVFWSGLASNRTQWRGKAV